MADENKIEKVLNESVNQIERQAILDPKSGSYNLPNEREGIREGWTNAFTFDLLQSEERKNELEENRIYERTYQDTREYLKKK